MRSFSFAFWAVAILGWLATTPVAAQQQTESNPLQLHAVNPSLSLSAPVITPLQQQIQEDYGTNLMAAQRPLLQQKHSGVGRQELAIGRQLNAFVPQ
jgi:hypothetical protein